MGQLVPLRDKLKMNYPLKEHAYSIMVCRGTSWVVACSFKGINKLIVNTKGTSQDYDDGDKLVPLRD